MKLFGKKQTDPIAKAEKSEVIERLERGHQMDIRELKKDFELKLREKDFEMKHLKDEQVSKLEKELHSYEVKIAELQKENKMLDRIVDLNGDMIDIKNLVTKLIDKLPSIDLKSLTVNNNGTTK
jgi:hypothetical protein